MHTRSCCYAASVPFIKRAGRKICSFRASLAHTVKRKLHVGLMLSRRRNLLAGIKSRSRSPENQGSLGLHLVSNRKPNVSVSSRSWISTFRFMSKSSPKLSVAHGTVCGFRATDSSSSYIFMLTTTTKRICDIPSLTFVVCNVAVLTVLTYFTV